MKKRIIALLLCLTFILSFTGCSKDETPKESHTDKTTPQVTEQPTESVTETPTEALATPTHNETNVENNTEDKTLDVVTPTETETIEPEVITDGTDVTTPVSTGLDIEGMEWLNQFNSENIGNLNTEISGNMVFNIQLTKPATNLSISNEDSIDTTPQETNATITGDYSLILNGDKGKFTLNLDGTKSNSDDDFSEKIVGYFDRTTNRMYLWDATTGKTECRDLSDSVTSVNNITSDSSIADMAILGYDTDKILSLKDKIIQGTTLEVVDGKIMTTTNIKIADLLPEDDGTELNIDINNITDESQMADAQIAITKWVYSVLLRDLVADAVLNISMTKTSMDGMPEQITIAVLGLDYVGEYEMPEMDTTSPDFNQNDYLKGIMLYTLNGLKFKSDSCYVVININDYTGEDIVIPEDLLALEPTTDSSMDNLLNFGLTL